MPTYLDANRKEPKFGRTVVTNVRTLTTADTLQRIEGKVGGTAGTVVNFASPVRVTKLTQIGSEPDSFGGSIAVYQLHVSDGQSFKVRADVSAYTVPTTKKSDDNLLDIVKSSGRGLAVPGVRCGTLDYRQASAPVLAQGSRPTGLRAPARAEDPVVVVRAEEASPTRVAGDGGRLIRPDTGLRTDTLRALQAGFERAGWDLREVDVDLVTGRMVVRIHRFDGRWLYLAARADGGATLERWHRTATVKRAFGAPNGAQFDTFGDQFLGRSRAEGIRSGLRSLSTYIAENPCPGRPALTVPEVRGLLSVLLESSDV